MCRITDLVFFFLCDTAQNHTCSTSNHNSQYNLLSRPPWLSTQYHYMLGHIPTHTPVRSHFAQHWTLCVVIHRPAAKVAAGHSSERAPCNHSFAHSVMSQPQWKMPSVTSRINLRTSLCGPRKCTPAFSSGPPERHLVMRLEKSQTGQVKLLQKGPNQRL